MSTAPLGVSGGVGGTNALLEDLDGVAAALGARALSCQDLVLGTVGAAGAPALLAVAGLDVAGAFAVQRQLALSVLALQRLALDVGGLGGAVGGAAAAYRGVDGASAAAWAAARRSLVLALGPPVLAVGAGVVVGGAVAVGAASLVVGAGAGARQLATGGATGLAGVALAWQTARRVGAASAVALAHGATARLVAAVPLPLRDDLVEQGIAATGVPAPVLAAGLLALAAPLGVWGATTASIRPAGPPVSTVPARSTGDLLRSIHQLSPAQGATPGSVRIDRITRPREPGRPVQPTVAVVHLPPTQQWFPTRGTNPVDGETNVRAVARQQSAVSDGVVQAMRAAGVGRREPVMLVGYSQGGIIAAQLAADPRFRAEFTPRVVLAAGSPIAHMDVPDDVTVLALEHDGDYVHALDGADDPDRESWTTVAAASGEPAHSAPGYAATADLVDASAHPSLQAWREDAAPFLADPAAPGGGASVTSTTWVMRRDP